MAELKRENPVHKHLGEIKSRFRHVEGEISAINNQHKPKTTGKLLDLMEKHIKGINMPEEWKEKKKVDAGLPKTLAKQLKEKGLAVEHHAAFAEALGEISGERKIAVPSEIKNDLVKALEERNVQLPTKTEKWLSPKKVFGMLEESHQQEILDSLHQELDIPIDQREFFQDATQMEKELGGKKIVPKDPLVKLTEKIDNMIEKSGMHEDAQDFTTDKLQEAIKKLGLKPGDDVSEHEEGLLKITEWHIDNFKDAEVYDPKQFLKYTKSVRKRIFSEYPELKGRVLNDLMKLHKDVTAEFAKPTNGEKQEDVLMSKSLIADIEQYTHGIAVDTVNQEKINNIFLEEAPHLRYIVSGSEIGKFVKSEIKKIRKDDIRLLTDEEIEQVSRKAIKKFTV